jgi:hypothetical protein
VAENFDEFARGLGLESAQLAHLLFAERPEPKGPPYTIDDLRAEPGTLAVKQRDDGCVVSLKMQLTGFVVTLATEYDVRLGTWSDGWEYAWSGSLGYHGQQEAFAHAIVDAALLLQGETPSRWTRNPPTGRRRPQGDPNKEFVRR